MLPMLPGGVDRQTAALANVALAGFGGALVFLTIAAFAMASPVN
jgi:hypothetical protein